MSTAPPSGSDADRAPRIADFVNASLLLDEWLDWMPSLCGQVEGFEEPFFVRSRIPRLALVPRLEPPPDEENLERLIAYGLSFFFGWHDPVRDAVSTWSHRLVASSGSAGAVRSSLISGVDPSTDKSMIWLGFPPLWWTRLPTRPCWGGLAGLRITSAASVSRCLIPMVACLATTAVGRRPVLSRFLQTGHGTETTRHDWQR